MAGVLNRCTATVLKSLMIQEKIIQSQNTHFVYNFKHKLHEKGRTYYCHINIKKLLGFFL